MTLKSYIEQIDGYASIRAEIAVLRKYGQDHRAGRGQVKRIIDRLHPARINLRVSDVFRETATTVTLRMVADNNRALPPFQAGQYINLTVEADGIRTSRPYSISSSPCQTAYYDLTVRQIPDGFVSRHLCQDVATGERFTASAPAGNFVYNPLFHGDDLVFLAGGSGITPFMSMIREITDRGLDRRVQLIYGSQTPPDIIFRKTLDRLSAGYPQVRVTHVISAPGADWDGRCGFISADVIRDVIGDSDAKMFYICGPETMYAFCLPELEKLGISGRRIRREVFGPPGDVTREPGWPVEVGPEDTFTCRVDGQELIIAAAEPLLNSLERHHLALPALCRSGECSLCRSRLAAGRVFQPRGARVRYSDRKYGFIHPCLAYPISDIELELP
ncbi:MAG: 2Fe-2S iron-sulfur cluster binding domain-containing protein [Desulfosarcina sp.]|nr:2Fe-2S iron-sulfur cluster binding domain-containing protein [Desulfobacterales bacterium]